jgi:mannose-1-phosphate guanylyltransferase
LYAHLNLDENRNAVQGNKVMLYDSTDNIIKVPNDKVVVMQAMNGYIVVENEGTLLICKKENEQQIKQFVTDLKINLS